MRFLLSWLKDYIHINLKPAEIAKILTEAGIEVENIQAIGDSKFEGVTVAQVIETEKHPNADKLCIATVTDGKETYKVVCGAPNCRKGLKTAFAPVGSSLKDEAGNWFVIKKTKLRGIESSGMLCSGKELGLSDEEEGIIELPESLPEGTLLKDIYSDILFEVGLTPNLAHCASLIGIARELSAATGLPIHEPSVSVYEGDESIQDQVTLTVSDIKGCPRYTCRLIKNVTIGESPEWLKRRLELCGLRSINNVVDVTNYVLLEMGHPLHAFDYDQLEGHHIIVREAIEGENFTTLDGKERVLGKGDLLIADEAKPVALAGIMGGMNSEVSNETKHVLLEAAYFTPVRIRRTSKQLGLLTDSSKRFERGTDPNNLIPALNRAATLIQQLGKGQLCSGIVEFAEKKFTEKEISCRLNRVNQVLGLQLGRGELETTFQRLGFVSRWEGKDTLVVRVPTYRGDILSEIDLIEEVARLYGYDNIPRKGGRYHSSLLPHAPIYLFEKEVQTRLIGEGLQEFLTCDLIGPTLLNIVQDKTIAPESYVKVMNPNSIEQSVLRTSLLPGLLQVVKYNIDHQNKDIAGFEIGRIHFKEGNQYKEQSIAGIVLSGKATPSFWKEKPKEFDFFDMKGIVENLLQELNIRSPEFRNSNLATFHSGRQASVFVNDLDIGTFGEIHPSIQRRLDVSQRILFGEFNLHDLIQLSKSKGRIKELTIYPRSERDWTITLQKSIPIGELINKIKEIAPKILEYAYLIDIYENEKLGSDYHNITLRFIYRDKTKTVSQEEVDREHEKIKEKILQEFKAVIK